MKIVDNKKHSVDILFPLMLFFLFAALCLIVLVMAANLYSSTNDRLTETENRYTPLAYVSEKFRQGDNGGNISLENIENTDCLVITSTYNDKDYNTYIYCYDGSLMEKFTAAGSDVKLVGGTAITDLESLHISEDNGLFTFEARDSSGYTTSLSMSERSSS